MGPAAESEEPLQQVSCVDSDGHQKSGGEPEPRRNGKKCTVSLAVVFLGLIITVIVLAVLLSERSSAALGPWCPACPDGWVGYRGKCYYFSEVEGNWNNSQRCCSSLGASLAVIDTLQDLDFLLRYKGEFDHWIGLQRDPGQPWKWTNDTEFNNLCVFLTQLLCAVLPLLLMLNLPLGQTGFPITADGDCGYLTENRVSSLRCTSQRHWICSKPHAFTKAKEDAVEGGSCGN